MEDIVVERRPELDRPILVMAYRGWNDAGAAATHATEYLVKHLHGERFASVDPDRYYDFTQARPHTRPLGEFRRELTWPPNEFYHCRYADGRDIMLFIGTEPHLRWRRYGKNVVDFCRDLGVSQALAFGALLADTPHTRPVPLSGGSSTPELAAKLKEFGINGSRYEGPTGILSVVGTMLGEADIPNGSIWAAVPHYISATPNPKASAALVRRLNSVFSLDVPVVELDSEAEMYDAQVESAIANNPEAQQYVRELELNALAVPDEPELDLAPDEGVIEPLDESHADGLIRSVEEFLRQRNRDPDEGDAKG